MFISYEVVVWIFDKLWGLAINLILLPIAILGLTLDYLRHWARRVSYLISSQNQINLPVLLFNYIRLV